MKEQYRWNYNIKIKTKEGTYEYEQPLDKLEELLKRHKGYEEVKATHREHIEHKENTKKLVKKKCLK